MPVVSLTVNATQAVAGFAEFNEGAKSIKASVEEATRLIAALQAQMNGTGITGGATQAAKQQADAEKAVSTQRLNDARKYAQEQKSVQTELDNWEKQILSEGRAREAQDVASRRAAKTQKLNDDRKYAQEQKSVQTELNNWEKQIFREERERAAQQTALARGQKRALAEQVAEGRQLQSAGRGLLGAVSSLGGDDAALSRNAIYREKINTAMRAGIINQVQSNALFAHGNKIFMEGEKATKGFVAAIIQLVLNSSFALAPFARLFSTITSISTLLKNTNFALPSFGGGGGAGAGEASAVSKILDVGQLAGIAYGGKQIHEIEKDLQAAGNALKPAVESMTKAGVAARLSAGGVAVLSGAMKVLTAVALPFTIIIGALAAGFVLLLPGFVNAGLAMLTIEGRLRAATGSSESARKEFEFLRQTTQKLGVNLEESAAGYARIAAAARGTALEGQGMRNVFHAIAVTSSALRLSVEETTGIIYAFEQIISKGKLSSEELRRQLGDRLPGAFRIAADSLGITTAALDDMLRKGEIVSDEFLPKFAKELEKRFGQEASVAANLLSGAINKLTNEWFLFKVAVGASPAFMEVAIQTINKMRSAIAGLNFVMAGFKFPELDVPDLAFAIEAQRKAVEELEKKGGSLRGVFTQFGKEIFAGEESADLAASRKKLADMQAKQQAQIAEADREKKKNKEMRKWETDARAMTEFRDNEAERNRIKAAELQLAKEKTLIAGMKKSNMAEGRGDEFGDDAETINAAKRAIDDYNTSMKSIVGTEQYLADQSDKIVRSTNSVADANKRAAEQTDILRKTREIAVSNNDVSRIKELDDAMAAVEKRRKEEIASAGAMHGSALQEANDREKALKSIESQIQGIRDSAEVLGFEGEKRTKVRELLKLEATARKGNLSILETEIEKKKASIAIDELLVKQKEQFANSAQQNIDDINAETEALSFGARQLAIYNALLAQKKDYESRGFDSREDPIDPRLQQDLSAAAGRLFDEGMIRKRADDAATAAKEPFLQAARNIQDAFADTFKDIFTGGIRSFKDLGTKVLDIFAELAAQIAALLIFKPAVGGLLRGVGLGATAEQLGAGFDKRSSDAGLSGFLSALFSKSKNDTTGTDATNDVVKANVAVATAATKSSGSLLELSDSAAAARNTFDAMSGAAPIAPAPTQQSGNAYDRFIEGLATAVNPATGIVGAGEDASNSLLTVSDTGDTTALTFDGLTSSGDLTIRSFFGLANTAVQTAGAFQDAAQIVSGIAQNAANGGAGVPATQGGGWLNTILGVVGAVSKVGGIVNSISGLFGGGVGSLGTGIELTGSLGEIASSANAAADSLSAVASSGSSFGGTLSSLGSSLGGLTGVLGGLGGLYSLFSGGGRGNTAGSIVSGVQSITGIAKGVNTIANYFGSTKSLGSVGSSIASLFGIGGSGALGTGIQLTGQLGQIGSAANAAADGLTSVANGTTSLSKGLGPVLQGLGAVAAAAGLIYSIVSFDSHSGLSTTKSVLDVVSAAVVAGTIAIPVVNIIGLAVAAVIQIVKLFLPKEKPPRIQVQVVTIAQGASTTAAKGPLFEGGESRTTPFGVIGLANEGTRNTSKNLDESLLRIVEAIDNGLAQFLTKSQIVEVSKQLQNTPAVNINSRSPDVVVWNLVTDRLVTILTPLMRGGYDQAFRLVNSFAQEAASQRISGSQSAELILQRVGEFLQKRAGVWNQFEQVRANIISPPSQAAGQIAEVNKSFNELLVTMNEMGFTIKELDQVYATHALALLSLKKEFEKQLNQKILEITNPPQAKRNEISDIVAAFAKEAASYGTPMVDVLTYGFALIAQMNEQESGSGSTPKEDALRENNIRLLELNKQGLLAIVLAEKDAGEARLKVAKEQGLDLAAFQQRNAQELSQKIQDYYQSALDSIHSLQTSMTSTTASPLPPEEILANAQKVFADAQANAGTDPSKLAPAASSLLEVARSLYHSGPQFQAIFQNVTKVLGNFDELDELFAGSGLDPRLVITAGDNSIVDAINALKGVEAAANAKLLEILVPNIPAIQDIPTTPEEVANFTGVGSAISSWGQGINIGGGGWIDDELAKLAAKTSNGLLQGIQDARAAIPVAEAGVIAAQSQLDADKIDAANKNAIAANTVQPVSQFEFNKIRKQDENLWGRNSGEFGAKWNAGAAAWGGFSKQINSPQVLAEWQNWENQRQANEANARVASSTANLETANALLATAQETFKAAQAAFDQFTTKPPAIQSANLASAPTVGVRALTKTPDPAMIGATKVALPAGAHTAAPITVQPALVRFLSEMQRERAPVSEARSRHPVVREATEVLGVTKGDDKIAGEVATLRMELAQLTRAMLVEMKGLRAENADLRAQVSLAANKPEGA